MRPLRRKRSSVNLLQMFIYAFLVEKVYIVWCGFNDKPRRRHIVYHLSAIVFIGYIVVVVLMVLGKNFSLTDGQRCTIGLKAFA